MFVGLLTIAIVGGVVLFVYMFKFKKIVFYSIIYFVFIYFSVLLFSAIMSYPNIDRGVVTNLGFVISALLVSYAIIYNINNNKEIGKKERKKLRKKKKKQDMLKTQYMYYIFCRMRVDLEKLLEYESSSVTPLDFYSIHEMVKNSEKMIDIIYRRNYIKFLSETSLNNFLFLELRVKELNYTIKALDRSLVFDKDMNSSGNIKNPLHNEKFEKLIPISLKYLDMILEDIFDISEGFIRKCPEYRVNKATNIYN
jgi:hypothetical protein